MSTDVANLNIKADATSVDNAKNSLKGFAQEARNTGAAARESQSAIAQMAEQIKAVNDAYKAEYQAAQQSATATLNQAKASEAAATATQAHAAAIRMSAAEYQAMINGSNGAASSVRATASETANYEQKLINALKAQHGFTDAHIASTYGLKGLGEATGGAGKTVEELGKKVEEAGHKAAGGAISTSLFTREVLSLTREASRGDMTRFAGSLTLLGQSIKPVQAAMEGVVGFLISPWGLAFAAAAIGVGVLGKAMYDGEKEAHDFQGALAATGNYAGITASQFDSMARKISDSQDVGIRTTKANIEQLVSSGKFTSDTIELMVENADKFSKMTGQSTQEILTNYEQMKGGVVKWAVKHEEVYHDLTLAQIDQIAALEKLGKHHDAELLAQQDIANNIKDRVIPQFGYLQQALHDTMTWAQKMWDAILGIGRPKSLDEQIIGAADQVKLDAAGLLTAKTNNFGGRGNHEQIVAAQRAKMYQDLDVLHKLQAQEIAEQTKANADAKKARDEDDAIRHKYDTQGVHKGPKGPNPVDQTKTEGDAVDSAIATAKQAYLQAELQLATSAKAKADLQSQIDQMAYERSIAQTQKQIDDLLKKKADGTYVILDANRAEHVAELEGVKATEENTKKKKDELAERQNFDAQLKHQYDMQNEGLATQAQLLEYQAQGTKSTYLRNQLQLQINKIKQQEAINAQQEIIDSKGASDEQKALATKRIADLQILANAENQLAEKELTLANAVDEAASATGSFIGALKSHNWAQAFNSFHQVIDTVKAAFASQGLSGGFATAGSAVGSVLGSMGGTVGKVGNAISMGAGVTGMVAGLPGMAATLLPGLADSGMLMSGLTSLAGLAGPIGIAVAAVAALSSLFLGSKPSNHAAITSFNGTDGFSDIANPGKETADTRKAVDGATQTILTNENALKQFGATLSTTVSKLDLGTRDMTHIFLSTGEELRSAIGDPAAAAETALQAVLKGAKFQDETEQKLVDSMVNAGKSFDEITTALQSYKQAQSLLQPISDQLLALQDPTAAGIKQIQDAIKNQQTVLDSALSSGYISTVQYAQAVSQLTQIQVLQLKQAQSQVATQDATKAQDDLNKAYQNQQSIIQSVKQSWDGLTKSLKAYRTTLDTGASAALSPQDQYFATQAAYRSTLNAAQHGDQSAIGNLQTVSQAYLDASKAYYASSTKYFADLAEVKSGIDNVSKYTQDQSDIAQKQLDDLDKQVDGLLTINSSVLSVSAAINNLASAQAAAAAANAAQAAAYKSAIDAANAQAAKAAADLAAATAANNNTATSTPAPTATKTGPTDWSQYVEQNPDLLALYNQHTGMARGRSEAEFGLYHYSNYGKNEGRQGVPGFAVGGMGVVGGTGGTDSKFIQFRATPGELVTVNTPQQLQAAANANAHTEQLLQQVIGLLDGANQQRAQAHSEQMDIAVKTLSEQQATKRVARQRK